MTGNIAAYKNLANAIIIQAVKDYRQVRRVLRYSPNDSWASRQKRQIEGFFLSGWFEVLTDLDGRELLKLLRKEKYGKENVA